jgi:hypothetical protein
MRWKDGKREGEMEQGGGGCKNRMKGIEPVQK